MGVSTACEGQMLRLLLGFPFGKNISLIYSIVLPGKAVTCPAGLHIQTLCTCPYTQYVYTVYTHTYCVYVNVHRVCMCISAGQVKSIEELPPVSDLPEISPTFLFYHYWGVDICSQPARDSSCLFQIYSSPVSVFQPPVIFLPGCIIFTPNVL